MGRPKHKKQRNLKVVHQQGGQRTSCRNHQSWWRKNNWNLLGLLLTIITGFVLPFYFQYESNIAQDAFNRRFSAAVSFQQTVASGGSYCANEKYRVSSAFGFFPGDVHVEGVGVGGCKFVTNWTDQGIDLSMSIDEESGLFTPFLFVRTTPRLFERIVREGSVTVSISKIFFVVLYEDMTQFGLDRLRSLSPRSYFDVLDRRATISFVCLREQDADRFGFISMQFWKFLPGLTSLN